MSRRATILAWAVFALATAGCIAMASTWIDGTSAAPTAERAAAQGVRLVTVGRGFTSPLSIVQAPGENRLLVVEQAGTVRPITKNGRPGPAWLDVSGWTRADGEQGLLGLAFAPDYARSGRFYINYTDRRGDTRVVELRSRPGARRVDLKTARTVLRQDQPYANHNGGALAFGSDGMLYVSLGDGGASGDPENRAQNPRSWLGKILRIDVSPTRGATPYAIPAGNAAETTGLPLHPEIWAWGLRNAWRMSVDAPTGDIWIADVGQSDQEEVNVARRGASGLDFGWNRREGTLDFRGGLMGRYEQRPVATYDHDAGCSVTGGYVYRGTKLPALRGRYIYADWCSGRSWSIDAARPDRPSELTPALGPIKGVTAFGQDRQGELYVAVGDTVRTLTPR